MSADTGSSVSVDNFARPRPILRDCAHAQTIMPYAVDNERDPLFYAHIHGWLRAHEVQALIVELDTFAARGEPFAVVLDFRDLRVPEFGDVRRLAQWFDRSAPATTRGLACVIDKPMLRGIFKSVTRGRKACTPLAMFDTIEEGCEWAEARREDPRELAS